MEVLGIFVRVGLKQRYKRLLLFAEKINILPTVVMLNQINKSSDF